MKLSRGTKLAALAAVVLAGGFAFKNRLAHVILGAPPFTSADYKTALAKGIPVDSSAEPKDLHVGSTVYVTALDGDRVYFVPVTVDSVDAGANTAAVVTATAEGDDPAPGLKFTLTHALGYLDASMTDWMHTNGYAT